MNNVTLDYLMSKMESRRRDSRRSMDSRSSKGEDFRDYEDEKNYDSRSYGDSRSGDRKGNVDFEGSMDFRDSRGSYDSRDYHRMRLSKTDIHHWKQMMENEDGSRGPHYDMQQIMGAAEHLKIRFEEFSEKEFCIAVNMMYSDYCKVARKYVAPDKELMFFADLAKAFLEDEDGPDPSEKLALYFHCIVDA